ncbi:TetR/AcrR family transcriptional regulator [Zooshikella harenae]|uniref:TetR family transcriptional regulator n=1 Tax=Zooshikella harenae TaxID=2827238 RepID=A0ABS5ZBZ3_9GAMM|nr:TetR/AcrR family transcriptional regulator [Zooshikella harenae]MBU2711581.1 TetR family transcriptional regulator [Zooshikella harenae]
MAQSDTVERILDAAEALFAEKGFAETSLRTITSRAGVNLAAVNYHFGSKKVLIQAVFSRFLDPFSKQLSQALDNIEAQWHEKTLSLEELLKLLFQQILSVESRGKNDLSIFMRLLGLAFSQTQGHLRKYLESVYGNTFRRYIELVVRAAPGLPKEELFWRINFMLGSVAFTMSGLDALRAIAEAEYGEHPNIPVILERMVPFLASGMRAEVPTLTSPHATGEQTTFDS